MDNRFLNNNFYDFSNDENYNKNDDITNNDITNNDGNHMLTMSEDKYTQNCNKLLKKNRLLKKEINQNTIIIAELRKENESINLKYKKLLKKFDEIKK